LSFFDFGNRFQKNTTVITNLIIANGIVFLAQLMFGGLDVNSKFMQLFALHHYKADVFYWHQIITHMFMHGSIMHIAFNMYFLYTFGSMIERIWGPKRFFIFYIACGVGAALAQMISYGYMFYKFDHNIMNFDTLVDYQTILTNSACVGASGAIMGVVAAFGYLFPNTELQLLFPPIPIKAKWLVLIIVGIDLFSGIAPRAGDEVAHFAHLGGALTGFLIVYFQNKGNRKTFY
jgi:membrane associated rhomboid family serine protease